VALPIEEDKGIDSPVTIHMGEAPYFLFVNTEDDSIQSWTTRRNPSIGMERKKGVAITEMLLDEGTSTLITDNIGEGPFHILRDSFVQIYKLSGENTAEKAINSLLAGELERYPDPSKTTDMLEDLVNIDTRVQEK
jgi:predicted Fe-Mo cluster-binding NifX family protein